MCLFLLFFIGHMRFAINHSQDLPEDLKKEYLKRIPLGRFGQAQDVAALVEFLASNEAGYITSQLIVVDGGMI